MACIDIALNQSHNALVFAVEVANPGLVDGNIRKLPHQVVHLIRPRELDEGLDQRRRLRSRNQDSGRIKGRLSGKRPSATLREDVSMPFHRSSFTGTPLPASNSDAPTDM
jgi:hypothetical protein